MRVELPLGRRRGPAPEPGSEPLFSRRAAALLATLSLGLMVLAAVLVGGRP